MCKHCDKKAVFKVEHGLEYDWFVSNVCEYRLEKLIESCNDDLIGYNVMEIE